MIKKIINFLALIATDVVVILICVSLAYLIRSEILPFVYQGFQKKPIPLIAHLSYFYIMILWVVIFALEGLYSKRRTFWDEARALMKGTTFSFFLVMSFTFIARKSLQFSRTIILLAWLLSLILFPVFRSLIKILLIRLNLWRIKVIVLGTKAGKLVAKAIENNKILGFWTMAWKRGRAFRKLKY